MTEDVKILEKVSDNKQVKTVYQLGEDDQALVLSVLSGMTDYNKLDVEISDRTGACTCYIVSGGLTEYLGLKLSLNGNKIYDIKEQNMQDARRVGRHRYKREYRGDYHELIAKKLYRDNSKEARVLKKFMAQITDNPDINKIKENMEKLTPRYKMAQLREKIDGKLNKICEKYNQKVTAKRNRKNTSQTLDKFLADCDTKRDL